MAQLVAHHTGSVGVTGSNPVSSTVNPQVHMLDLGVFIVLPGLHEKSRRDSGRLGRDENGFIWHEFGNISCQIR